MTWTGERRKTLPSNWRTVRVAVLNRDPVCQLRLHGCTRVSTEVDHIDSPTDHSPANLRGVCHPCHAKRTAQQAAGAKPRARRKPEQHPGLV